MLLKTIYKIINNISNIKVDNTKLNDSKYLKYLHDNVMNLKSINDEKLLYYLSKIKYNNDILTNNIFLNINKNNKEAYYYFILYLFYSYNIKYKNKDLEIYIINNILYSLILEYILSFGNVVYINLQLNNILLKFKNTLSLEDIKDDLNFLSDLNRVKPLTYYKDDSNKISIEVFNNAGNYVSLEANNLLAYIDNIKKNNYRTELSGEELMKLQFLLSDPKQLTILNDINSNSLDILKREYIDNRRKDDDYDYDDNIKLNNKSKLINKYYDMNNFKSNMRNDDEVDSLPILETLLTSISDNNIFGLSKDEFNSIAALEFIDAWKNKNKSPTNITVNIGNEIKKIKINNQEIETEY